MEVCLYVKHQNAYVDYKNVTKPSINTRVRSREVRFQFWVNYPFSM